MHQVNYCLVLEENEMKIVIDWEQVDSEEKFFDVFLPQIEAPDWHGRNLDALNDSLVSGGINGVEPPFCIVNNNTGSSSEEMANFQRTVFSIFADAVIERNGVEVIIK